MAGTRVWCLLPAERVRLAGRVLATGALPILDLTFGGAPAVPPGVGVRVDDTSMAGAGDGPVLARAGEAIPGRACWRELTAPGPVPDGYAGVVLRSRRSGGWSGEDAPGTLRAAFPEGVAVVVDLHDGPGVVPPGSDIVLLSDVVFAAIEPPPRLAARLGRLTPADWVRFGAFQCVTSLASAARRRVAGGEAPDALAKGWFASDDTTNHLWPAGEGLLLANALLAEHGSLEGILQAYVRALTLRDAPAVSPPSPAPSAPAPSGSASSTAVPPPAGEHEDLPDFVLREPVALIGMGCRLPGAASAAHLWAQILAGFDAIIPVPPERWDPALYWSADKSAPDKTYAKLGGFVTDFTFNPRRFRIPPGVARTIDPIQQMALEAAADALDDAGYGAAREYDRERVAVILGNSMGGEITNEYTLRVMFPAMRKALEEVPDFAALPAQDRATILLAYETLVKANLPPITEDSMPGELSNVVAGRIANALNLGGPNFTTDAACAGSMAAIQAAVKGLQDGDFDLALTGGADRSMGIPTYTKFSKIGALSPDGSRPFDADANGFVMGEGAGILVLKRQADAVRDGDRIYAVIRGIGASSDGKGKGITAPNPTGQMRALQRAYHNADIDPREVDLFECHGTSTVVGDKVEVDCLTTLLGPGSRSARGPARIGSIKSNIGHLKSAAGAASVMKAALALFHRVYPPSINYRKVRPDLDLSAVPLQVQTAAEPWASSGARRAGVSSFGFGGTNFHVVLEEHLPGQAPTRRGPPSAHATRSNPSTGTLPNVVAAPIVSASAAPIASPRPASAVPVPEGLWALSADSPEELIVRCRALKRGHVTPFEPDAALRLVAAAENATERDVQIDKAIAALQKGKGYDLLRQRGIILEDVPCDGQLAFVFTGQGSQYIGMGLDLAEVYPIVADTFREADEVLLPVLGRPLTSWIRRDPALDEDGQFEALRATEISQPATLTVDIAIMRLLAAFGARPDVVAGHSLGEYGAAVSAGMMSFADALLAVSARGREMAAVKLDDFGKMAGIATSVETVEAVLAEIPGYVVAANKNCPTQTVIAGESEAVEAATEAFKSRGITVYPLPVSHAFHSRIVAPATEPLRRVLQQLDLRPPVRRITTNVDSRYYPSGPDAVPKIVDILARQVASPVEWIAQVERMYNDGARIFVECGPKRALTGFVVNILKHRPHRALYTNQPKRGGVLAFRDALAALLALGFPIVEVPGVPDVLGASAPRRSTTPLLTRRAESRHAPTADEASHGAPSVERAILKIVAAKTGYAAETLDLDYDLESDLGIDTVKLADIIATVRDHLRLDPDPSFRMGDHRTLRALIDYAGRRMGATRPGSLPARRPAAAEVEPTLPSEVATRFLAEVAGKDLRGLDAAAFSEVMLPALRSFLAASWQAFEAARPAVEAVPVAPAAPSAPAAAAPAFARGAAGPVPHAKVHARVVCSGASIGLPGGDEVFGAGNVASILAGENRIDAVPEALRARMVGKNLVRLVKNATTGQGEFQPLTSPDEVIRLAGRRAHFDLVADYGIDASLVRSLDITTQLAFAAGLEALKDAQIPLVRTWKRTSTGKSVATGWALPASMREDTGIVFASAFPGYDLLLEKLASNGDDGEGHFDRRFLFQVLSMGHSQFAQLIQAKGPNTAVNAACASTTQAISIAEDWIRVGRCRRVIVVGADDVTSDRLLEWIGAGFLAAGAATTEARVEDAALPFDRRRHGMILGMGAVGLVLETDEAARERAVVPVAELLGTRISNSAFHGTRLDQEHISREVKAFAASIVQAAGVDAATFARRCVFLSHETYTPARGGSAAAEMASLPAAFGVAAEQMVIANTKGYTGHAMGAGIEDAVAVKALQFRLAPPIANLREPDPDLGRLTLSRGGAIDVDYALRLSAGFGSQLALAAWRRAADGHGRILEPARHEAWLTAQAGPGRLVVEHRQLRYVAEDGPAGLPILPGGVSVAASALAPTLMAAGPIALAVGSTVVAAPVAVAAPPDPAPLTAAPLATASVVRDLVAVIAAKSGYDPAEIDPAYELEADLGIDTVKQAEIFGEMRDRYGLARDDSFRLADHSTVAGLAAYLAGRANLGAAPQARAPISTASAAPAGVASVTAGPAAATPVAAVPVTATPPVVAAAPILAPADLTPPTPAGGAASTVTRGDVLATLVRLVAARTGYDPAEIDPAYELEADLGIDTVKQAEIFGEVRSYYGLPRDDAFRLSDYPTVDKLSGYLAGQVGRGTGTAPIPGAAVAAGLAAIPEAAMVSTTAPDGAPAAAALVAVPLPVPAVPAPPAPAGSGVTPDAVLPALLDAIARRTGYDVADLDPAYELEADLGVDTVKQAEIFGEIRTTLGIARDDGFRLSDHPTIAGLAAYLASRVGLAGDAPPVTTASFEASPAAAPPPQAPPPEDEEPTVALQLVESDAELPEPSRPPRPIVAAVLGAITTTEAGFWPTLDDAPPVEATPREGLPADFRIRRPVTVPRAPANPLDLTGSAVRVLGEGPLVDAVTAELRRRGAVMEGAPRQVVDLGTSVWESFREARRLDSAAPEQWLAVLRGALDATGARDEGARAGLAKALGREWRDCRGRVLTVAAGLSVRDAAMEIVDELASLDRAAEVWRDRDERSVGALETEPFPGPSLPLTDPVVLLTGGTRGITARVALAFAQRGPCQLVLVARNAPGRAPLDEDAARLSIKAELGKLHRRVTPKMVEDQLRPLRDAEDARANVVAMRATGARVDLRTADLADPEATRALVAAVLDEHGRIDVCIHGAGAEESRRLAEKDEVAFHRVYDAKAEGGLALATTLPVGTFFLSMGSVAGRFGNPGQVDYAAANEAMAQVCRVRPNALHIAWTAWGDTGMAVRGGMESLLTSRGVSLLPAAPGASLVYDLVASGTTGEIVVAGALGDLAMISTHPLLDAVELVGDTAVATCTLSAATHPWLLDHAIEGVPVLPGVIGLEMMVATAMALAPRARPGGVTDVRFDAPVKLHRDEPVTIEVRAFPEGEGHILCRLSSRRTLRTGRVQQVDHFQTHVVIDDMPLLPTVSAPPTVEERIECEDIYRRFFHGPAFQVLHHTDELTAQAIRVVASVDHAAITGGLLTDPLALEAALQGAGLHTMTVLGRMELPAAVDAVEWVRPVVDGDPLKVYALRRGDRYDIDVDGSEGRVLRVRGYRGVARETLDAAHRFRAPVGGWASLAAATAEEGRAELPREDVAAMTRRGLPARQDDRLAGQLAARRAVAAIVGDGTFHVEREESGAPRVVVEGGAPVSVSIAHQGGLGVAMAARGAHVGIDLERHEPRHPSFNREWFTEAEQERLGSGLPSTRAWAVKEAVLKVLGTGMRLSPRDVEVHDLGERRARVLLRGDAARRHAEQGGEPILVRLGEFEGRVVATAVMGQRS